jgi:hypothetical protein
MTKRILLFSIIIYTLSLSSCRKCYSCFDETTDEFIEDRCGKESREEYSKQVSADKGIEVNCVPKAGGR